MINLYNISKFIINLKIFTIFLKEIFKMEEVSLDFGAYKSLLPISLTNGGIGLDMGM